MPSPARQRIVVPFAGHVIGQGFNSDTGERVGTGLDVGQVGEDTVADGQTAAFRFEMVTSQRSLETALNISAEIEARYLLFSAGAKFSFAEKNAVNTSSTYVVASCTVSNALRFGRTFTPTTSADRLLRAGDMDGFKRAFGDRFCHSLRTGGEFNAIVRITSSNTSHQSKIAASLHGELNALVAGGSFKAAFERASTDTASHTEVAIDVFQIGGQGGQVQMPGTDADKIRDHMNRFAASVHEHAQAFEAELVTYDTLAMGGPSADELEDRRRVLEDCQARKQKYWSAISELEFLQGQDAPLIFTDLPSPADLAGLQNEFRRVLSALMAHARAVSTGAIPTALFVPEREPILPRFARRNATTFAIWWAQRDAPELLQDERTLVRKIGNAAASLLSTPLGEAPPSAVQNAAALLEELDLSFVGAPFDSGAALQSIAALPRMIASPLQKLVLSDNALDDLEGVETFTRLESLGAEKNRLEDIRAVTGLAGLKGLQLRQNEIEDLSPIAALTRLEVLLVDGNNIRTLEPLRGLTSLRFLLLGASVPRMTQEGEPPPPPFITTNPVVDGRALASLPGLANPFVLGDRLAIRLTILPNMDNDNGETLRRLAAGEVVGETIAGTATRIGTSTRFRLQADGAASSEPLTFVGILAESGVEPRSWVGVLLDDRKKVGLAIVDPATPRESLTITQFARMLQPNPFQVLGVALVGLPPEAMIEARVI